MKLFRLLKFLRKSILFLFFSGAGIISCTTTKDAISPSIQLISESEFQNVLSSHTRQKQIYSGLYNSMDITATLITSKVAAAQMDQMARLYLWDENKYTQEKVKSEEKLKKETEFFVSFFTPERKHDDLHKNQTLWKIFLDVGGKRYEGKTKKIKLLTEEIQGIYAYHNRFATPYSVIFPVAVKNIESFKEIKMTVTGPVGSATLEF
jgi:hypothetical protein